MRRFISDLNAILDIKKPIWLLALAFIILNIGLGSWGLTEPSEARYAEIGLEMYRNGDYIHPTELGIRHYHKPPITYYLTSLGYTLFGSNEFGARFFLSVGLILQILFVWKIALLLFKDRKIALAAAIIYFSIPLVLLSGRFLTTDVYLNTCVLGSIYFFISYRTLRRSWQVYTFYLLLAVGFLTKGPAVIVPVGAFVLIWKILHRESIEFNPHTFLAGLSSILVGGSWYLLVSLDNPSFLSYFFNEQIINRMVSATELHRAKPFWYYLLFAPLVGFPWLPFGLASWLGTKDLGKNRNLNVQLLAWSAISIILAYSFVSSKLIFYILPAFPFVAILCGYYLFHMTRTGLNSLRWALAILCGVFTLGIVLLPWITDMEIPFISGVLFVIPSILFLMVLMGNSSWDLRIRILGMASLVGVQLVSIFTITAAANPEKIHTYKEMMAEISEFAHDRDRPLLTYNFWAPSISWYWDQPVITVRNGKKRIGQETKFEQNSDYKENFYDIDQAGEESRLLQRIHRENPILIFLGHDSIPNRIKIELDRNYRMNTYHKYHIYH